MCWSFWWRQEHCTGPVLCVSSSGLWAVQLLHAAPSEAGKWRAVCLPLTTPRHRTAVHSLTWEDEKERKMFLVLLCESVYIHTALLSALDYLLVSLSMLLPKCSDYVRNVASPENAFFLFGGSTWFSCFVRHGLNFLHFFFTSVHCQLFNYFSRQRTHCCNGKWKQKWWLHCMHL